MQKRGVDDMNVRVGLGHEGRGRRRQGEGKGESRGPNPQSNWKKSNTGAPLNCLVDDRLPHIDKWSIYPTLLWSSSSRSGQEKICSLSLSSLLCFCQISVWVWQAGRQGLKSKAD
ncbi:hypothetical protein Mp_6g10250 [Marchantia polymorpha subsp. ruderalis]|uniref:Uncharacterized protein n=2 Tax=Marchantia polymorpha TaxID=3197 RepID=A0AAF6BQI6_MARPO|nr:hypothetical protein MARPO_0016s0068 [Marchantia polymorpha]BBN14270.1 hypothetical protein Mp_6g10250 [Marchantia polymorpha subsp. ruderalis]|eukprot:PTQ45004.1 hypothetical protein MARPO_0016s0068 [Marchantia polymorpha]